MPAYSFQEQFCEPVETGRKTHTIRGKRKHRPKPGQTFYGYYAMRTKACRKLIQSIITRVQDITIVQSKTGVYCISIDGEALFPDEKEALAVRDGFANFEAMTKFWPPRRLPFFGDIIHWNYEKRVK